MNEAPVAQGKEHPAPDGKVAGSTPAGRDRNFSFAHVLFPFSNNLFLYKIPEELKKQIKRGILIEAPFLKRIKRGIVFELRDTPGNYKGEIKDIVNIFQPEISIPEKLIELCEWMSWYYMSPLSKTVKIFLPPLAFKQEEKRYKLKNRNIELNSIKNLKEKKIIKILKETKSYCLYQTIKRKAGFNPDKILKNMEERGFIQSKFILPAPQVRKHFFSYSFKEKYAVPEEFTDEQSQVFEDIKNSLEKGFNVFLLHGVTGSGKTYIYLKLIQECFKRGKSCILLVPEIGIIPQMFFVFNEIFKEQILLWGSAFSNSERFYYFHRALTEKTHFLVIGPRSAIFAPLKNTGLIIIDEEQESAYRENERVPLYHARDTGIMRGKIENIPVLLGTATPQVETLYNSRIKKYSILHLKKRVSGYSFPEIRIIDLKREKFPGFFSSVLLEEIEKALINKKQTILFINRRGFAHYLQCKECGYVFRCERCSITLTYHKAENRFLCHYCGYERDTVDFCPGCKGTDFYFSASGTEKIESEIREFFPNAGIIRMDLDTTRKKRKIFEIFEKFRGGEKDILLGTQMLVKGFDFPGVNLIGIINADLSWNFPDFRARERAFHLLNQLIGRARKGGKVLIQTFNPQERVLKWIIKRDEMGFYKEELRERKELFYPPYSRLAMLELKGTRKEKLWEKVFPLEEKFKKKIEELNKSEEDNRERIISLGPAPAPVEKLKNYYRVRFLFKAKRTKDLHNLLEKIIPDLKNFLYRLEIDPVDFV